MQIDIIKNILIVGCGSFLGGAARYLISIAMKGVNKGFPWGTLLVNLIGCLIIGLLWVSSAELQAKAAHGLCSLQLAYAEDSQHSPPSPKKLSQCSNAATMSDSLHTSQSVSLLESH